MKTKPNGYWTYEHCLEEAKKYDYKVDFAKNSPGAYYASLKNNWICKFDWFLNGIKRTGERNRKWNYETCYTEAKKSNSRGEFVKNSRSAYNAALKNNWLADYTWFRDKRFDIFKDKIDCIYVYEFIDQKAAYIGRTLIRRAEIRDKEHIFGDDVVSSFAKENNISIPKMKIIETDLTLEEGAKNEGIWIDLYREDGWEILNRAKPGSIGALGKRNCKWDYDSCKKLAEDCTTISEFRKASITAYNKSVKENWISEYTWLKQTIHKKEFYTEEKCLELAKKYTKAKEFRKNELGAYNAAKKNNWLDNYTWLEKRFLWTKETVLEEAKKYKTSSELERNSSGAYYYMRKHSLLDECSWFNKKEPLNEYWTYSRCLEESKKYKSRTEFNRSNYGAYSVASKNNWLDDFFPKLVRKSKYDNYDICKELAKDCRNRSEYGKKHDQAWRISSKNGWLDEFFPKQTK